MLYRSHWNMVPRLFTFPTVLLITSLRHTSGTVGFSICRQNLVLRSRQSSRVSDLFYI